MKENKMNKEEENIIQENARWKKNKNEKKMKKKSIEREKEKS